MENRMSVSSFMRNGLAALIALLLAGAMMPAHAVMLIINNPSIENPPDQFPYSVTGSTNWYENFVNGNAAGRMLVTGGMFIDPTPDGLYAASINNNYFAAQDMTNVLAVGTYVLNTWLGERADLGGAGWSPSVALFDLLAGGTALTATTFTNNIPTAGHWVMATKVFNISDSDPHLGQTLTVKFTNPQAGNFQANFDNVTLSFVPEPASGVLLAGGAAALVASRRRKRAVS